METPSVTSSTDTTLYTGQVKWFNSKSGYGFITIKNDCDKKDSDIFVHYTNITTSSQYKYLMQGEYVEFNLLKSSNTNHEFQAVNVTGILKGELMCQIRKSSIRLDDNAHKPRRRVDNHSSEHSEPEPLQNH